MARRLGLPLRGCISFGKMAFDSKKDIIFGEPLFDLIEQEKKSIVYPRIAILPSAYELLANAFTGMNFNPKWHDFISLNYIDMDGLVCVDWIKHYFTILLFSTIVLSNEVAFFGK